MEYTADQQRDLEVLEDLLNHLQDMDEITPPATPPTPPLPSPPPVVEEPPLSTKEQISLLYQQYNAIIQKITGPHIISVAGIKHLKNVFNRSWKDKVYQMLYEACVPFQWVIDIVPEEEEEEENSPDNPDIVHVYFLNETVQNKTCHTLNYYLIKEYNHNVFIR